MSIISGTLYIVATPIGNLEDISIRAKGVLADVDLILAEDTRHSKVMLKQFGIMTKICSYHDHNERKQSPLIIRQLQEGISVALISDAGTPLICDPGYHLLLAAHTLGIKVIPIPGPSALISALSVAGFSSERFRFEGYLPARKILRQQRLEALKNEKITLIFYEAPHRIFASIAAMIACFGGARQAMIAKEMTKLHEAIYRGTLADLLLWLDGERNRVKGEFVVVVNGGEGQQVDMQEIRRVLAILLVDHSVKDAVRLTSEIMLTDRNKIYSLAMELRKARDDL